MFMFMQKEESFVPTHLCRLAWVKLNLFESRFHTTTTTTTTTTTSTTTTTTNNNNNNNNNNNCNWVVTRWQWLFYMYRKYETGY